MVQRQVDQRFPHYSVLVMIQEDLPQLLAAHASHHVPVVMA